MKICDSPAGITVTTRFQDVALLIKSVIVNVRLSFGVHLGASVARMSVASSSGKNSRLCGLVVSDARSEDLVAVDTALTRLAAMSPRRAQVVELRFFGGLSVEETAEALKVSSETVKRDWRLAKAWLLRELASDAGDEA
jgi:DNA-binding NarL/FixJ family response regulator